ncbi:MAG: hypothetical protein ACTHMX_17350, partial [Thermomicrobiales bacterium]
MRRIVAPVLAVVLILAAVAPVTAGGWAFVELAAPLEGVMVGRPVEVRLRVLPHGMANHGMVVGSQPLSIVAVNIESGKELHTQAMPDEGSETYRASITFPEAGI